MQNLLSNSFSIHSMVSCMPPPYGGVSVHVDRLHSRLLAAGVHSTVCSMEKGISFRKGVYVFCPRYYAFYQWVLRKAPFIKTDIFHAHGSFRFALAALAMSYRARGVAFTFHDQMVEANWKQASSLDRFCLRKLFQRPNFRAVAVSPIVRDQLVLLGLPAEKIHIIHAFIPPVLNGLPDLPEEVEQFISNHSP